MAINDFFRSKELIEVSESTLPVSGGGSLVGGVAWYLVFILALSVSTAVLVIFHMLKVMFKFLLRKATDGAGTS